MLPSAISAAQRMDSLVTTLTCAITLIIADSILCAVGTPTITSLLHGGLDASRASLIYGVALVTTGLLIWCLIPSARRFLHFIAFISPFTKWTFWSMPENHREYMIPTRDALRRATENNNTVLLNRVSQRRQEVERDQTVRIQAVALIAAVIVNANMSGSIAQAVKTLVDQGGWISFVLQITIACLGTYAGMLALFAFVHIEEEDWMSSFGV